MSKSSKPPTGQVHISPTGAAWAADADAALADLEAHLASTDTADVRAKLAATGFTERHAFLWVDYFNFVPPASLGARQSPRRPRTAGSTRCPARGAGRMSWP